MICFIRIQAQEKPEKLWDSILANKDNLEKELGNKGKMLYLSKRYDYNAASLFVHVADTNLLGDFIVNQLVRLEGVTGICVINMMRPIFFPLPEETHEMKRFAITVAAFVPRLAEIYDKISKLNYPQGILITYLAYTCHTYGDCLQFSLLAKTETELKNFISMVIDKIPGILRTTVCELEKNHPFITHEVWQKYASRSPFLENGDERDMIAQFWK